MSYKDTTRQAWSPPDTSTSRQKDVFDSRPERDWMNPIAMSTLKSAVEKRAKTVILNGTEFSLTYRALELPLTGKREVVRIKRTDGGFAPFGEVALETLEKFKFEG